MFGLGLKEKIIKRSIPIRTFAAKRNCFFSSNDRRLWEMRDRHLGEECVLIGMGPSLRVEDLSLFSGLRTFACNKIFLAMKDVDFCPDYYMVSDILVASNNKEQINTSKLAESQRIYPSFLANELDYYGDPVVFRWRNQLSEMKDPFLRLNPLEGLLGGGMTVVFEMLQFAYLMGFKTVYMVGVDFSFDVSKPSGESCASGDILVSEGEKNHFLPGYRKPGETWTVPKLEEQRIAFSYAAEVFRKSGRKLLNASRRTKLDTVDRVDFEKTFCC